MGFRASGFPKLKVFYGVPGFRRLESPEFGLFKLWGVRLQDFRLRAEGLQDLIKKGFLLLIHLRLNPHLPASATSPAFLCLHVPAPTKCLLA